MGFINSLIQLSFSWNKVRSSTAGEEREVAMREKYNNIFVILLVWWVPAADMWLWDPAASGGAGRGDVLFKCHITHFTLHCLIISNGFLFFSSPPLHLHLPFISFHLDSSVCFTSEHEYEHEYACECECSGSSHRVQLDVILIKIHSLQFSQLDVTFIRSNLVKSTAVPIIRRLRWSPSRAIWSNTNYYFFLPLVAFDKQGNKRETVTMEQCGP